MLLTKGQQNPLHQLTQEIWQLSEQDNIIFNIIDIKSTCTQPITYEIKTYNIYRDKRISKYLIWPTTEPMHRKSKTHDVKLRAMENISVTLNDPWIP